MFVAIRERYQKDAALRKAIKADKQATEARQEVEQFASRLTKANLLLTNGQLDAESELWSSALDEFTRALELQPSYHLPWVLRGQFYARLYMGQESAEDYRRALNLGAPVDAPLAIALSGQGNQTDPLALLEESKRQIDDWVGYAIDIDSVGRKLPWYYLVESIAVNRQATHKVYGM